MRKQPQTWACVAIVLAMAGCVAPNVTYHSDTALPPPLHPVLTVLQPDAVVYLQTAGGMLEPRADWSENVASQLAAAVESYLFDAGVDFIDAPAGTPDDEYTMRQSINLVLDAVELATVKGAIGDARTYTMDATQRDRVREATGADYALAVVFRANRSSGGRLVLEFFAGGAMESHRLRFRSALIDLRDGHVKWANFDANQAVSNVNPASTQEKRWRQMVDILLSELPL